MNRIMKFVAAAMILGLWASSASAALFRYDVEATGFIPGQAGGKSITATSAAGSYTMDVFGLFQGDNALGTDDSIRSLQAYFRSSNGGLLGDLSAQPVGIWNNVPAQGGTQFNNVDADGDLDIGISSTAGSYFAATISATADNGFGVGRGGASGTVTAASIGLTGADFVYAKLGTLTFTVTAAEAASAIPGAQTIVDMIGNQTGAGGPVAGNFSAHEASNSTNTSSTTQNQPVSLGGVTIAVPVPEPASLALAGLGAVGLVLARRRRS